MTIPLSISELCLRANAGEQFSYLYFWGHRPYPKGLASNSCLSQWYASPFKYDGMRYMTAEHFMMAQKARLFGDTSTLDRILKASSPGAAKSLGREVSGFEQSLWENHRFEYVVRGNLAKFEAHKDIAEFLLNTGNKVLVEASPVDSVWGIGLAPEDEKARDPNKWQGLNLLGFALMVVRERLLAETGYKNKGA
jgi:ribA/ribD-fused uncharacterized protein